MIAARASDRRSLEGLVSSSGLRSLVVGASKDPNAKLTILLVPPSGGDAVLAVKVPTTDEAALAIDAERRVLEDLSEVGPGRTIPRVAGAVEFEGRQGLVMTAVPGIPMATSYLRWRHTAGSGRVAADFAAVDRWLGAFQALTAGPAGALDMDGGVAERLAARFAADGRIGEDLERLAEIHARLREAVVPRTAVHGDLWCGNVLLDRRCVTGVVDWEAGAACGEGVRDLARFAHMYALFLDRRTGAGRRVAGHPGLRSRDWGEGVIYALEGSGWFPEIFRRFLQAGLARLGAPARLWRDAALAGIAEVAALTDDGAYARSHLDLFRRTRPEGKLS